MGKYTAFDVACYIVNSCIDRGRPISNLQLQKILYYVQAAFLIDGEKLFSDKISAWKYGPVVEDVYRYFKKYVNGPITERIEFADAAQIDDNDRITIDAVVRAKSVYSAFDLVSATHREEPWRIAVLNNRTYIEENDITEYFFMHRERIYQ